MIQWHEHSEKLYGRRTDGKDRSRSCLVAAKNKDFVTPSQVGDNQAANGILYI